MSSTQELKCNQCLKSFDKSRKPLRMPICKHNICACCLTDIKQSHEKSIECGFCGKLITELKVSQFTHQKLITDKISKNYQEKRNSKNSIKLSTKEQCQDLLIVQESIKGTNHIPQKPIIELCQLHSKPIEIICQTDSQPLCSMCALFVGHKQHKLITTAQFQQNLSKNIEILEEAKHHKYKIINKISSDENLDRQKSVHQKLVQRKAFLITAIEGKFKQLIGQINKLEISLKSQIQSYLNQIQKYYDTDCDKIQEKFCIEIDRWSASCQNTLNQCCNEQVEMENKQQFIGISKLKHQIKVVSTNGKIKDIQHGEIIINRLEEHLNTLTTDAFKKILAIQIHRKDMIDDMISIKYSTQKSHEKNKIDMEIKMKKPMGKPAIIVDKSQYSGNAFICDFSKEQLSSLADITQNISLDVSQISIMKSENDTKKKSKHLERVKSPKNFGMKSTILPNQNYNNNTKNFLSPQSKISRCKSNNQLFAGRKSNQMKSPQLSNNRYQRNTQNKIGEQIFITNKGLKPKLRNPEINSPMNQQQSIIIDLNSSQSNIKKVLFQNEEKNMNRSKQDAFDLSDGALNDQQILFVFEQIENKNKNQGNNEMEEDLKLYPSYKKLKLLKLSNNCLTTNGFKQLIPYLKSCTNLNLSGNQLDDSVLDVILNQRDKLAPLRLVNLSKNNINSTNFNAANRIKHKIEALRKIGILVHL